MIMRSTHYLETCIFEKMFSCVSFCVDLLRSKINYMNRSKLYHLMLSTTIDPTLLSLLISN